MCPELKIEFRYVLLKGVVLYSHFASGELVVQFGRERDVELALGIEEEDFVADLVDVETLLLVVEFLEFVSAGQFDRVHEPDEDGPGVRRQDFGHAARQFGQVQVALRVQDGGHAGAPFRAGDLHDTIITLSITNQNESNNEIITFKFNLIRIKCKKLKKNKIKI